MKFKFELASCVLLVFIFGCETNDSDADGSPDLAGGATTVFVSGSNAYSTPSPNLSGIGIEQHADGDAAFEQIFVTAPAGVNGGLGPVFNNTSCINCHVRDGRGLPFVEGSTGSLLFRLSIPGSDEHGGPVGIDGFGGQLQVRSVEGFIAEGNVTVNYTEIDSLYPDGNPYSLLQPAYTVTQTYTNLPSNFLLSPRFARSVFGLGLLEAISESDILDLADENDTDQDGISGRPNYVWDIVNQKNSLGRFGWKANQPNLLQQNATAYQQDMGITSYVHPLENSFGQTNNDTLPDDPEIDSLTIAAVTFYTQTLGVPAPRNQNDQSVREGKKLFEQALCQNCHVAPFRTNNLNGVPEVSNQVIYPYTDMLLHDMGEGLADNRSDFLANGREWRTPPLWGIGLSEVVNGHTYFLHDGRARNIEEAILWHGGEAQESVSIFKHLTKEQRSALLQFINSL
ncbi:thiol oxidoreductase [bacterium]|nr:thiol oxidoreductase [bacterium]